MRHRNTGRKLGRKTQPREALRRDVVNALFRLGRIETTVAKAKEFRPWAERLITVAKRGTASGDATARLTAYRRLLSDLHDESVVKRLLDEIAPQFADRPGGYTRILRIARGRLGDNAPTVVFELVTYDAEGAAEAKAAAAADQKAPRAKGEPADAPA